jgi:hypothetical protein
MKNVPHKKHITCRSYIYTNIYVQSTYKTACTPAHLQVHKTFCNILKIIPFYKQSKRKVEIPDSTRDKKLQQNIHTNIMNLP